MWDGILESSLMLQHFLVEIPPWHFHLVSTGSHWQIGAFSKQDALITLKKSAKEENIFHAPM